MTQKAVSQKEINDILWQACDTFRGTLDPTQYKDYILVMLFIKYMSDLWKRQARPVPQAVQG
jgi:type I restriction enzyme M protein